MAGRRRARSGCSWSKRCSRRRPVSSPPWAFSDIFDVHARAFYRDLALLEGDNPSRLRLGYLKVDDEVLATFSGTICHGRMSGVLCSLADGKLQRLSPGALLLKHQIEEACAKGLSVYDIGAGEARHKDQWCDVVQPLFDSFIAFKPHGLTLTLAARRLVASQAGDEIEPSSLAGRAEDPRPPVRRIRGPGV